MINTEINIRRSGGLWGGVSPENVKRYQEELETLKKEIHDFRYERYLFVSPDLRGQLDSTIEQELDYCAFYDEYQRRLRDEPGFGEWVFRKQEDIPKLYGWKDPPGEQWTKTNGRVKAIIQFDRTGKMVRITLKYENDSTAIHFYAKPYKFHVPMFHVKSEKSIDEAVQEFKRDADTFLAQRLLPPGATSDLDYLKQLLCVT